MTLPTRCERRPRSAGPFTVTIILNHGDFAHHYDTCDLTADYIKINASYRS